MEKQLGHYCPFESLPDDVVEVPYHLNVEQDEHDDEEGDQEWPQECAQYQLVQLLHTAISANCSPNAIGSSDTATLAGRVELESESMKGSSVDQPPTVFRRPSISPSHKSCSSFMSSNPE